MNKSWFEKDRPTNVISFSYIESSPGFSPGEDGKRLMNQNVQSAEIIGDIIISLERAQEEAEKAGCPFYERLFALVIHGLLHILGFNHEIEKNEARRMKHREQRLLDHIRSHDLYGDLVLDQPTIINAR
jgi:probable rRNA maturation factor